MEYKGEGIIFKIFYLKRLSKRQFCSYTSEGNKIFAQISKKCQIKNEEIYKNGLQNRKKCGIQDEGIKVFFVHLLKKCGIQG